MNDKIEELLKLPLKIKIGVVIGSIAIIGGLFWFLSISPLNAELSSLDEAVNGAKGLHAKIQQKRGIARNLKRFEKEVEFLEVELKKALSELPDKKEIGQLLTKISDRAKDSGLEIRLFKPQPEKKKEFYAEVPVDLELVGTFHQIATFFDEVGRLERIVNLEQFSVYDPKVDQKEVFLSSKVTATSFRFLDESERPDPSVGEEGKTTKKRRAKKKKGDDTP